MMLILTRYAKAWAALVVGFLTAFAQFTPLATATSPAIVATIGAFLTALAVYLVANRVDGFNVNAIAQALIDAGEAAVGEYHGGDNDEIS